MSLVFTNYDRTQMCNHAGMLGRELEDGSRVCVRCGATVPPEAERFTGPVGRGADRPSQTRRVG